MMVAWLALLWPAATMRERALNAFAAAMAFTAACTWLNVWFQLPWSQSQNQGWGVTHHVFGDYITQNVMMALFVLLALYRAHAGRAWVRWAWAAMAALSAVTITHLSDGRTGYVLLAVAVGVFILTQLKGKTAWLAILAGVLLLGGLLASSDTMRARFDKAIAEAKLHDTDNASSIGHRLYNYKTTPRLVAEKPWLGWGTGAYHTEICHVLDQPEQCPSFSWHPHNQYLFFAAEHGLVGVGLYLALLGSMAWLALRSKDAQARTLLLGLSALLAVNSLFNSPLWSARESHFFTLMAALLVSMAWASRQADPPRPLT
jgi:O-antigen ligase